MSRAMRQPYVAGLTVPGRFPGPARPRAGSGSGLARPAHDRLRVGDCVADLTAIPSTGGPLAAAARDPGRTFHTGRSDELRRTHAAPRKLAGARPAVAPGAGRPPRATPP